MKGLVFVAICLTFKSAAAYRRELASRHLLYTAPAPMDSMATMGTYGSYGTYGPPPDELLPFEPSADSPDAEEELPLGPCMIDHGMGCEQCEEGAFKVGPQDAIVCEMCEFENCIFCNDFYGCAQCEEGFTLVDNDDG